MSAALENFNAAFSGKRFLALGEMLELGESAAEEHARIAEIALSMKSELIILVGKNFSPYKDRASIQYFNDSTEAAVWIAQHKPTNGSLLIKGSRGSKMEKILDAFQ
jgi:UDP-N-acetylmuramoyl-tripeptide--D-alanyl-D-alanine ligase